MQLPSAIEKLYITLCPNNFISFPLEKFPCFLSSANFFPKSTLKKYFKEYHLSIKTERI